MMAQKGRKGGPAIGGTTGTSLPGLVVLALLSERPMHGYELLREFERQEVHEWVEVSRAHVYHELKRLAAKGFILAIEGASGERRDRTVYRVSDEGTEALAAGLSDPAWARAKRPAPFLTWIGLSIHTAREVRQAMFLSRAEFLREELVRTQKALEFITSYDSIRVDVGRQLVELYVQQIKVELRWLETLVRD